MKLTRNKRAYRFYKNTTGLFGKNVLLSAGVGLPFVVMAAVSLKSAVALVIAMICSTVPAYIASILLGKKSEIWLRTVVGSLVAVGGVLIARPIISLLSPEIFDALGIFMPLMAINSLIVSCSTSKKFSTKGMIRKLIFGVMGFSVVAILVGGLREILVAGNLWGVSVAQPGLPIAGTVFVGFLFLGFLAALVQSGGRLITAINHRIDNPTLEELERQEKERMVD